MLNKLNIRKARAKMQFLLGGQGYAIRDKGASSKAARRAARTKVGVLQQALEDAALPEHKLDKLSKTLAVQCFLSEYYRYKLGVLDSDLGFPVFTVIAQADSWSQGFQIIKRLIRNQQIVVSPPAGRAPDEPDAETL